MLLNLLTDKNNLIKVNYPSSGSVSLPTNIQAEYYTIKSTSDITSLKVENQTNGAITFSFNIISPTLNKLKSINYNASLSSNIKIEYSLDYNIWNELPYKGYMEGGIQQSYKYIESIAGSADNYLNLDAYNIISVDDSFKTIHPDWNYIFTKKNMYSQIYEDLYNNFEFMFLKITVEILSQGTFYFNSFNIIIDEDISDQYLTKNILTIKSNDLYRSKYFEDQSFLPDQINSYMNMLEGNTSLNLYMTNLLQKAQFSIEDYTNFNFYENQEILPIGRAIVNRSPINDYTVL